MKKSFDYLYVLKSQDSIEVEDIGNCCLHAFNDDGFEWFMDIYTELGITMIKTFGPFHVDLTGIFPAGFNFNFTSFDYKESKISTNIDKFINDSKNMITQVYDCDREEAYKKLSNINFMEMGR